MKILIVTHCWAVEHTHFAAALCYQLSSLLLHQPRCCEVTVAVCCEPNDSQTLKVCKFFSDKLVMRTVILQNEYQLGRRCIGRDFCTKDCVTDLVWFTDVDHVFGNGCLDTLALIEWPANASMIYPQDLFIHKDHATGDTVLSRAIKSLVIDLDTSDFVPKHYNRAIGGVQIVQGTFAREHGYLRNDLYWKQPAAKPFGDFRDDVAYRRFCLQHGSITSIALPNLFRLRHSTTTYQ